MRWQFTTRLFCVTAGVYTVCGVCRHCDGMGGEAVRGKPRRQEADDGENSAGDICCAVASRGKLLCDEQRQTVACHKLWQLSMGNWEPSCMCCSGAGARHDAMLTARNKNALLVRKSADKGSWWSLRPPGTLHIHLSVTHSNALAPTHTHNTSHKRSSHGDERLRVANIGGGARTQRVQSACGARGGLGALTMGELRRPNVLQRVTSSVLYSFF